MCAGLGVQGRPVTLPDPSALGPEAELHESRVADHHLLESGEFIDGQIATACVGDHLSPTSSLNFSKQ